MTVRLVAGTHSKSDTRVTELHHTGLAVRLPGTGPKFGPAAPPRWPRRSRPASVGSRPLVWETRWRPPVSLPSPPAGGVLAWTVVWRVVASCPGERAANLPFAETQGPHVLRKDHRASLSPGAPGPRPGSSEIVVVEPGLRVGR